MDSLGTLGSPAAFSPAQRIAPRSDSERGRLGHVPDIPDAATLLANQISQNSGATTTPTGPEAATAAAVGTGGEAEAPPKRKRAKLSAELLCSPKGLQQIQMEFPEALRAMPEGMSHVEKLDYVLALYRQWGDKLFPRYKFEDFFESTLEMSNNTNILKEIYLLKMGGERVETGTSEEHANENEFS